MATAVLENINPYSQLGLRRRPTYDELINLINENASLFGPTPDRRASAFKASPEGSFFDGLNYTDKLKEEQERILNKQMRDILFRQNVGNQSIAIAQLQQNNQASTATQTQTLPSGNIAGAGIDAQLEQVRQQQETRRQQTGEAHRGMLPTIQGVMSNILSLSPSRTRTQTPMAQTTVERFNISSESEPELMTDAEMQTARGEPSEEPQRTITYSRNISSMTAQELKFQLFLRGVDVDDPEINLPARKKGKGSGKTQKQVYQDMANELIRSGRWETRIEEQLLRSRIEEYRSKGARGSK